MYDHISTVVEDMESLAEDAKDLIDLVSEGSEGVSGGRVRALAAARWPCMCWVVEFQAGAVFLWPRARQHAPCVCAAARLPAQHHPSQIFNTIAHNNNASMQLLSVVSTIFLRMCAVKGGAVLLCAP